MPDPAPALARAGTQFVIAAAKYCACLFLAGGSDDELNEAYIEMRCAKAIFEWEIIRSAGGLTTPDYDEETIDALLRGARG